MAKVNLVKEHFTSIHQMLNTVNSRPNNSIMNGKNSSKSGDKSFTGTKSWEEANELFEHGYTEILPQIKAGVAAELRKSQTVQKRRTSTGVVGYAAHVPNAIMGLPNSMIYTQSTPQKIKAVSICYCITRNAGTDAQEFIDSGVAILNVINRLELNGCRVNLKVMFYCAKCEDDYAFGTVDVKDFREHLNLQKLCFPVANPSMFRRFGFKWLETCNGLKESDWAWGYGRQVDSNDKVLQDWLQDNEYYIDLPYTKRHNYDAEEIIKSMDLNL